MNVGEKFQCIYCEKEIVWEAGSKGDHVVPARMGHFCHRLMFERMCKSCNVKANPSENVLVRNTVAGAYLTFLEHFLN